MSNIEEATIPFHGGEIVTVRDESGEWMSVNQACAHIGIAPGSQITKLRGKPWALLRDDVAIPDSAGRHRQVTLIHVDSVPMWMATIEPLRVKESSRAILI